MNDIVGLSVTNVTFGGNATSPVTISGQPLTNCVKILNNTTNSTHHIFKCEVVCRSGVTPDISRAANNYIVFSGGLEMSKAPTANGDRWSGKITVSGSDAIDYHSGGKGAQILGSGTLFSCKNALFDAVAIGSGATGAVDNINISGCCRGWGNGWCSLVFDSGHGVLKVGEIKTTGDAIVFHSYASTANNYYGGTIIARKVTCAATKNPGGQYNQPHFFLNCGLLYKWYVPNDGTGEGIWALGSGGLSFGSNAIADARYIIQIGGTQNNRPGATIYSYQDWALAAHPKGASTIALSMSKSSTAGTFSNTHLVIDTSHYNVGDAALDSATSHIVTLNGRISGTGGMGVKGSGTVVFANKNTDFADGLWASNSVRVVVNSGCKPGSGNVTLRNTSTLELKNGASTASHVYASAGTTVLLPEDGTATIGGNISFWSNSNAKFHVGKSGNARLAITGTVTAQKNITISLTEDSDPAVGQSYALTEGAELTALETDTTSIKLADGVKGELSVVDGELVYTAPTYFVIKVK